MPVSRQLTFFDLQNWQLIMLCCYALQELLSRNSLNFHQGACCAPYCP